MKRKEKENVAQPQKNTAPKRKHNGVGILIGLVLSAFVFAALLFVQMQVVSEDEGYYKDVYVIKENIPEMTKLTKDNLSRFVTTKTLDVRNIPATYIEDIAEKDETEDFLDKYVNRPYLAGDVLTMEGLTDINYTAGIADPVQVSFSVGGIDQIVAGTVREGDEIDIYVIRANEDPYAEDEVLVEPLYLNKKVVNSFTSSGEYVNSSTVEDGEKDETPVQLITIVIEKADEEMFFKRLNDSNFRVAKVLE